MAKYKFNEAIWNSDIWFIWYNKIGLGEIEKFKLWAKYNEILTYITLIK